MHNRDEVRRALILLQIPSIGPVIAKHLLEEFGSLEELFSFPSHFLQRIPRCGEALAKGIQNPQLIKKAEAELQFIERNHIGVSYIQDPDYPVALEAACGPPLLFFYLSDLPNPLSLLAHAPAVSIVGTRKATTYGLRFVNQFVTSLAAQRQDMIIVSGLALGIDTEAHKAALAHNLLTIGVLGHGFRHMYPAQNRALAKQVRKHGMLVTEFISTFKGAPSTFIQRNRIIAGLAAGTLVVESDIKGGAMSTAAYSFNSGRETFALPGPVGVSTSAGCNYLIKKNRALLIESAQEVLRELNFIPKEEIQSKKPPSSGESSSSPTLFYQPTPAEKPIVQYIQQHQPVHIDMVHRALALPMGELNSLLFQLEFQGVIKRLPGGVLQVNL